MATNLVTPLVNPKSRKPESPTTANINVNIPKTSVENIRANTARLGIAINAGIINEITLKVLLFNNDTLEFSLFKVADGSN